jgi:hypothetical protein
LFVRLVKICWFTLKWGLLAGVIGLGISIPRFYQRVDSEICRSIEARFAQHYPDLQVSLRHAELVKGKGIQLRGLSVLDPAGQGPRAELIRVDEVFLTCCADLEKLLVQEPEVTRVVVRRPLLRITRRQDGTWSAARLLPMPHFGPRPPEVVIEGGTIEIFDPWNSPGGTLTLRDVNLRLIPGGRPAGPSAAAPAGPAGDARWLEGDLVSDLVQRVRVEGWIDTYRPQWDLRGSVEGLQFSPALRNALPQGLAARLRPLGQLRAVARFDYRLIFDPAVESSHRFALDGELSEGRWDDGRLPHPLAGIHARFHADNRGFAVEDLRAAAGQAALRLSCRRAGYEADSPMRLSADVRQLDLDPQWTGLLPAVIRTHWDEFSPAGQVNASVTLDFDGRAWRSEAVVECLDTSLSYVRHPYRIEHAKGSVELKDDVLRATLTGYSGSQPIEIHAETRQPFSGPWGWFHAEAENLPLDDKLLSAIPEPSRGVVRSLDPQGKINLSLWARRDRPGDIIHRDMVVTLNRCWVQYHKFPYPLAVQGGRLEMHDGRWTLQNVTATNETGVVTASGEWGPGSRQPGNPAAPAADGTELNLYFHGEGIALSDQLRAALRPEEQRLWTALRPRGAVDLDVKVHSIGRGNLDVGVCARLHGAGTSVEPALLPYRMEKLSGMLTYQGGRVVLEGMRAEHGNVKILVPSGQCTLRPDGAWQLHLERLSVDRLRPDRELLAAVPDRVRRTITALGLASPVNLFGTLDLAHGPDPNQPISAQWDVHLNFAEASLDFGVKLENINGGLWLVGGYDGRRLQSRGELSIDSLHYRNYQVTEVYGPIGFDDGQVLLGEWVDPPGAAAAPAGKLAASPRPVTAQLFGGTLRGDGWVGLEPEPRYRLSAGLVGADLTRWAKENLADGKDLRGRIDAQLDLHGSGRSLNGLGGQGAIRLHEADIYETPLMVRLLKFLSIRRPSPTAFSNADMRFRIQGPHIYLDRLDFNGDTLSLIGQGSMNFQGEIHLVFHPQLGRGRIPIPWMQQFWSGASKQLMSIYVDGTLQDPEITRQPLPGVNQALQEIQGAAEGPGMR